MDDRQRIGSKKARGEYDPTFGFMILGICIIMASIIGPGIYIGYIERKEYLAARAAQEAINEANRQIQEEAARQQARRRAQAAKTEQQKFMEQQNSPECQFWQTQNSKSPSEKTAAAIRKHCPFG